MCDMCVCCDVGINVSEREHAIGLRADAVNGN